MVLMEESKELLLCSRNSLQKIKKFPLILKRYTPIHVITWTFTPCIEFFIWALLRLWYCYDSMISLSNSASKHMRVRRRITAGRWMTTHKAEPQLSRELNSDSVFWNFSERFLSERRKSIICTCMSRRIIQILVHVGALW
jgi:hypothetical protein